MKAGTINKHLGFSNNIQIINLINMYLMVITKENVNPFRYLTKANIENISNGHHTLSKIRQVMKVVEGFRQAEK